MALQPVIQKILDLRAEQLALSTAVAGLASESLRMSARVVNLELEKAVAVASEVEVVSRVEALENDSEKFSSSHVDIAKEAARLAHRITHLELGSDHPNLAPVLSTYCDPAGHELLCGAVTTPVTMVAKGNRAHDGAALTMIVDELANNELANK